MPPGQIEQDDKMLYCTIDIQYQWYISDIPVIYQWLNKGRIDKMSVVLLTRTYVIKQQWKKPEVHNLVAQTLRLNHSENSRWQNGKQYKRKTNSAQSALEWRASQGCTGPSPHLTTLLHRVAANFLILCFAKIFVAFCKIQNYFLKILCFAKFWQNNFEFCEIWGKFC